MAAEESAIEALRALIDASPRARVSFDELEFTVAAARPDLPAGVERRALLARVLGALVDEGVVRLPRSRAGWQAGRPPMPKLVTRLGERRAASASAGAGRAWRPELAWAATARITQGQVDALEAVQRWLRDRPAGDPPSGLRERSVDIFGDDKALEGLLGGSLFAPDRLSLELLDCGPAAPPLVCAEFPRGHPGRWLIVENATTYRTLAGHPEWLDEVGLLVYGAGAQAPAGVVGLLSERPAPDRISYFGDIDRDGLRLAIATAEAVADEGVTVLPHLALYRLLVARGLSAPSRAKALEGAAAEQLAAWLQEPELQRFARQMLQSGRRGMQEQVGPAQLSRRAKPGA